jgi:ergothioneine biosynthesis protein EgtB
VSASLSLNSELTAEFLYAVNWVDRLFAALEEEAMYAQPIKLRHPCIFYLGHLPAFAWNQVFRRALNVKPFNPEFDRLFERGIDPDDLGTQAGKSLQAWPPVPAVAGYKMRIETELFALLAATDLNAAAINNRELLPALQMTLEHYLMHVETFVYMMHQLPLDQLRPFAGGAAGSPDSGAAGAGGAAAGWAGGKAAAEDEKPLQSLAQAGHAPLKINICPVPGGAVTMGTRADWLPFAWDNEVPVQKAIVGDFQIDKYPVTNGQFLEFVEADGYRRRELWSEDGWQWLQSSQRSHPQFWLKEDGKWYQRHLFEVLPLDLTRPVWVSKVEADAFARFRGACLPSEAQYHRAAFGSPAGERRYPWGNAPPDATRGNFGFHYLHAVPIGLFPAGASAFGVHELMGNGWEWTSSPFEPFAGFQPLSGYPGYSADFFDGRHFVLKGASPITAYRLMRPSFRNWFQPHYPYLFAKFRCVYPPAQSGGS